MSAYLEYRENFKYNATVPNSKLKMQNSKVRTRIAPSPTGFPHIGTIYQALFDFAYAKKNHGSFIVRIEDTDRERFVEGTEQKIYEALDFFGLSENESPRKEGEFAPYRQSERLEIYKTHAKELLKLGGAYLCFCSKERLLELHKKLESEKKPTIYDKHCRNLSQEEVEKKLDDEEPFVVRLKIPETQFVKVKDEIRGEINFETSLLEDAVLIKSDGYPTYHFASVVDDHLMEISHVIRGNEWISSTPKHLYLYEAFGWNPPVFAHLPVILGPDRQKLSKRHGAKSALYYRDEGYLKEALLNFIALLGWRPNGDKEIMSLEEMISLFKFSDINTASPIFDMQKLDWMNGVYIRSLSIDKLKEYLIPFYPKIKDVDPDVLDKIILISQTRIKTLKAFEEVAGPFLFPITINLSKEQKDIRKMLKDTLSSLSTWTKDEIGQVLKEVVKEKNIRFPEIYESIIGQTKGLPLADTFEAIGKERALT